MKPLDPAILVLVILVLTSCPGTGEERIPGPEVLLPEADVRDRFFSYLIGLIESDVCGMLDAKQIGGVLKEYSGRTSIPFETVRYIERQCKDGGNPREVTIEFTGPLHTPVPYSILGYHPGSVRAPRQVRFLEWEIPSKTIRWGRGQTTVLSDIYVFGVCEGWAVVDIHTWVDKLLAGLLDDTRVIVMVLFRYQGAWHGLAAGYDPDGHGRSGVFNFSENRILFPTPEPLKMVGPYFRHYVTRVRGINVPLPPEERWRK
jgi:hypothetical protein